MYEIQKFIHVLAIATWFGSGVALTVIGLRSLRSEGPAFPSFALNAGWWAGRAHPIAGVVLLITGLGMVFQDGGYDFGDAFILIALVGLVVTMGVGGALVGPTSARLMKSIEGSGGTLTAETRPLGDRLLNLMRLELALLVLIIADMVLKPGV